MAITVKVARVPGAVVEVALNDGATVGDALAAAGFSAASGESMKVGASTVSLDTVLADSDRIVLAKDAKGA